MNEDDRRGGRPNRFPQYLREVCLDRAISAPLKLHRAEKGAPAVQKDETRTLDLAVPEGGAVVRRHEVECATGTLDPFQVLRVFAIEPLADFQSGLDLGRLRPPDPLDRAYFGKRCRIYSPETGERVEHSPRKFFRVHPPPPGSENDGEKLRKRETLCTGSNECFPRPLLFDPFRDGQVSRVGTAQGPRYPPHRSLLRDGTPSSQERAGHSSCLGEEGSRVLSPCPARRSAAFRL